MFIGFLHSPPYSFYCSFSWKPKTNRFSNSSLSRTYYNQVTEFPLPPSNTRHGVFYLTLCASFPRSKASSKTWCAGTKLAAGVGRAWETFCWSKKVRFCRPWSFLGNPSERLEVEWATNGIYWHLNLIFFKCGTQAVVSSSAGSTELFPLLPPQHNPNVPIFCLKVFFMDGFL